MDFCAPIRFYSAYKPMRRIAMRFQINIDCSPEEARQFFGLPDVLPMQQDLMEMVSRRLSDNIQNMEPEALMKTWVPALFQGWTDMQSQFWSQMTNPKSGAAGSMNPMNFTMNMGQPKDVDDAEKPASKKKK